MAYPLLTVFPI